MINKTILLTLIFATLNLTLAMPLAAQTTQTPQDKNTQKIKEKVKKIVADEKVTKKVKMNNGAIYLGFIGQPTEDSFVVQDKDGNSNTLKYSDVKSIDKKDLSTGAKIGFGAAAGAGALILILFLSYFHCGCG